MVIRRAVVVGAAGLALLASLDQPRPASADTARIVRDPRPAPGTPPMTEIVITGADGTRRTLGRYDIGVPEILLRISPDRRWIALVPYFPARLRSVWIVPTDGGPARTLTVDPAVRSATDRSGFWWTSDSQALIVGDTMQVGSRRQHHPYRSRVLRCALAATVCRPIPGVDGVAATVPGAIVTSSSVGSLLPYDPGRMDSEFRWRTVERDPSDLRRFRVARRSSSAVVADAVRTLRSTTSSLAAGIDGAFAAVSGPAAALIVHRRLRTAITARKAGGHVVRWRPGPVRWTLVAPHGGRRTITAPRLRIPMALADPTPENAKRTTVRATVEPRAPLPDGRWLAEVRTLSEAGYAAVALAVVGPDGRAALLRNRGGIVSAADLIRTTIGARAPAASTSLRVVGHETATDAAVLSLGWPESRGDRFRHREATVRVPLDGQTAPSLISRHVEDDAW